MNDPNYDVLILGCGIAGLVASIKIAEQGYKVAIITCEERPEETNTFYAQGGIIYANETDTALVSDIQSASGNTSHHEAVELILKRSGKILEEMLIEKCQVPFDRGTDGKLLMVREAAHSYARILHTRDYTGQEIQLALLRYALDKNRFPNIALLDRHTAIDLLTPVHHGIHLRQRYENDRVVGAYILNQNTGEVLKLLAKATILATGGFAALYLHHSNKEKARGDGIAMAKRAGVFLNNMEFIQFHPTTFFDRASHRRFLISEAVRGEGAILVNAKQERFMPNYHVAAELAPRDVVARAILDETIRTGHDCVYLDISHRPKQWLIERFPTIYKKCKERGIDISTEPIPVVPAAHYTCGGIKTDLNGQTNLKGLYAIGEVACTGLHGANRLASTSLLEGLTCGYTSAEAILNELDNTALYSLKEIKDWEFRGKNIADKALIHQDWTTLRQTMWNYLGLARSSHRLSRAQAMLQELNDEVQKFYRNNQLSDDLIGLRNALEVAHEVLLASKMNCQSIGCFYRID